MRTPRLDLLLVALLACTGACTRERPDGSQPPPDASVAPVGNAPAPSPPLDAGAPDSFAKQTIVPPRLTLFAAGDVSFGRLVGQMLLSDPGRALFASMEPLLRNADVRFVNLEGPISDRGRETVSPHNNLVFNGPPVSAHVLSRAGIDVVSTANNHAWDYGRKGLLETLDWLEREHVLHVGSGETLEDAYRPVFVERNGFRLAVLAVNDVWNQRHVPGHSAREHVASPDEDKLAAILRSLRRDSNLHAIAMSYHGGEEYRDEPSIRTRKFAEAMIDAGVDVFIGHHPHVVQGIAFHRGRPILYSLGNLLMRMHSGHPETEMGLAVRIELSRNALPRLFACPIRIFGVDPIPLAADPQRKASTSRFARRLATVTRRVGTARIGPFGEDGCALVEPSPVSP